MLPEVAFAGRSNVGKSTLLNRLVQRRSLARTSRTPGCTRGVVLFRALLRDGTAFVIADLPGYGFAERSKGERDAWAGLIERYLKQRASLVGVVILADARRGIEPEEEQLITYLEHIKRPFMVALTKVDKLSKAEKARATAAIHKRTKMPVIGVSGETGEGREEILRRIRALVGFESVPSQAGTERTKPEDSDVDPEDDGPASVP